VALHAAGHADESDGDEHDDFLRGGDNHLHANPLMRYDGYYFLAD